MILNSMRQPSQITIRKIALEKSGQNQDSNTSKIAASLGCDDDWERWVSSMQRPNVEEEHGPQQHCKEGDTSELQDKDKDEKYNFKNNSKRLHTQLK